MARALGVVAAGHEVTAQAAAEMLADGGNAFDAVLAGLLAACVPEVVLASIGGGGFLMAQVAGRREPLLYDFFAQTPRVKRPEGETDFHAIHADFGPARQEFHIGLGSTATPGFVQGLFAIHDDLCRLPIGRIAEPAIRVAREGVTMSAFHAYLFTVIAPILTASDGTRALFAPNGKLLEAGDTFRNPDFGETLDGLAHEGVRLFTEGEIARAMVDQSRTLGGHLTLEDLKRYRVERRAPLAWDYRGAEVLLNPGPAASGALIAFGLGLIEQRLPGAAPSPLDLAQAMADVNGARAAWGETLSEIADGVLIAQELARAARHRPAQRGTTHISVIDAAGNAAAATITNGESNGHVVPGLGFMLNNMLGEEDLNPQGFHLWQPDMRLSSMMAPTLLRSLDGAVTAMGSGGSNRIRSALLQVAVNLIDHGLPLDEAVTAARLHVERDNVVSFEDRFPEAEREALLAAYPEATVWPEPNMFFGGVHTARRTARGGLEGAGDPRRGGVAMVV